MPIARIRVSDESSESVKILLQNMTSKGRPRDKQRCSVIDCPSTRREKSHHFPKYENLGDKWVKATGNPDLLDLNYQQIYDNKYCICLRHFANEGHLCGVRKRLKEGTVPTLFLLEQEGDFSSRVKNDSKIDLEKIENCSAEINVTPTRNEFSPISFLRNWNLGKSGNDAFWRKSSLLVSAEKENSVSGGLTATPKTEREKLRRRIFSEVNANNMEETSNPETVANSESVECSDVKNKNKESTLF